MKQKLLYQGAEAKIILSNNFIIKDRIKKSYRLPELDNKIRKQRTKSEAKLLEKASKIVNTPKPFFQPTKGFNKIKMPYINGKKLSQYLDSFPLNQQKEILKQIGQDIAKLHYADIIHGDLTTSNMILVENLKTKAQKNLSSLTNSQRRNLAQPISKPSISEPKASIYFIDFGLSFISKKLEDKSVDIHLLKQALEAKHFKHWEKLFKAFLEGYKSSNGFSKVLEQLAKVEKRGRYRH